MKFNSQICTSREQSERLLALGLKKETADCTLFRRSKNAEWEISTGSYIDWVKEILPLELGYTHEDVIPAWSLGRLLALVNGEDWRAEITLKDERYGIHIGFDTMWYDDIFEAVIAWIEEDIKEGYFPKEYLV
jgi:hypothetical protein